MKQSFIFKLLFFLILNFFFSSCFPRIFNVPKGDRKTPVPGHGFLAGAAETDITPFPGSTMAGFGEDIGQFTRGNLGRLYVKSTYVEDSLGNYLFIVACDLWAFPKGLGDRVMNELKRYPIPGINFIIARENVLFTATHTHNAQGNYSTSYGYNAGSSTSTGFDKDQFRFLISRIKESMELAYTARESASVEYSATNVFGLSRNRSIKPWRNNRPEDKQVFYNRLSSGNNYVSDQPECLADDPDQFVAVNPVLTTILINSNSTGHPISVINNYTAHPTVLGSDCVLASADVFGVASVLIQNYLRDRFSGKLVHPIVSFINGAEGDISMNWKKQGREEMIRLGEKLGIEVIELLNGDLIPVNKLVSSQLVFDCIRNREVNDPGYESILKGVPVHRTAKKPAAGKAIILGAEDGRVDNKFEIDECNFSEAIMSHKIEGGHAHKDVFKKTYLAGKSAPAIIPFGMHDIGQIRIIAVPGECSVALGERLIKAATKSHGQHTFIAGLANEYMSYLTTPEEYKLQHYEGASTIYGLASGLFIEQKFNDIHTGGISGRYAGLKWYFPGIIFYPYRKNKIRQRFLNNHFNSYHLLKSIAAEHLSEGIDYIKHTWTLKHEFDYENIPEVKLETLTSDGWKDFIIEKSFQDIRIHESQNDKYSYNFMNYIARNNSGDKLWETIWIPPQGIHPGTQLRFSLECGSITSYSKEFVLN
ncbi:MAG: neutral/alkaline non-lysosomal ceramidase N-terminal domain-containing protein [Bacteroidia bacterium]|nr:neutral/alkaline non-lysosomal ceramidase N-terminal domain-containing protein [Bacteroidia bacterium]